jgi:hypothetical protein
MDYPLFSYAETKDAVLKITDTEGTRHCFLQSQIFRFQFNGKMNDGVSVFLKDGTRIEADTAFDDFYKLLYGKGD